MAMEARAVEALIRAAFPQVAITVQGDHGAHFSAEVIDASFRGLNRVQRQRGAHGPGERRAGPTVRQLQVGLCEGGGIARFFANELRKEQKVPAQKPKH